MVTVLLCKRLLLLLPWLYDIAGIDKEVSLMTRLCEKALGMMSVCLVVTGDKFGVQFNFGPIISLTIGGELRSELGGVSGGVRPSQVNEH
jgi:hypothetical protein